MRYKNYSRDAADPYHRRRRFWQGALVLAFGLVPAVLCQFLAREPQDRHIHVESFRYGKEPAVIRCNRGDKLHLTFSTRDTAHSFFLEELDVDAKIDPGTSWVLQYRTSDPQERPIYTQQVVLTAEHPGWLNYVTSKSHYRCHVWCGPMHAFEHGNLIIWPNTLLFAGLGMLVGIPVAALLGVVGPVRRGRGHVPPVTPDDGFEVTKLPGARWFLKRRWPHFALLLVTMAMFAVVLLTTFFGTKMSGRNLGIMLLWVVWLFALTAVLTPLGGRIWCWLCPLPLAGEWLQRMSMLGVRRGETNGTRNRFFGLNRPWPGWLANAWPRMFAFLAMGTFSTLLVALPIATGWVLLAIIIVATGSALIWELRGFCRYVCPINGFIGLYSSAAPLALRRKDGAVCAKCKAQTCLTGSAKGWACPYGLCVADINENADCGLCMECFKSCAFDNVALRWRPFAQETRVRSYSEAFLAMSMLTLAAAYCTVHLGHWRTIRDAVDIVDQGNWAGFGAFAAVLWGTALVVLPGVMLLAGWLGKRAAGLTVEAKEIFRSSSSALVPIGLMLWISFVVPMLSTSVSFVAQSLSDPFGWGWDFFGTSGMHWHQLWPRAVPWVQVAAVLAGLGYSLRNGWRVWLGLADEKAGAALRGMLPLGALLVGIAGWFIVFFAN